MLLTDYYTYMLDYYPQASSYFASNPNAIYRAINKARRRVSRETDATLTEYNFPFVAGQQSYPFPTVNGCIMQYIMGTYYYNGNMRIPANGSLRRAPIGVDWWLGFNSWPWMYYDLNGYVYYWPIPSFAYSAYLKGKLEPIDMTTASGPDAIIPSPFVDAVVVLSASLVARLDGNIELGESLEQEYMKSLATLPRGLM